MSKKQAEEELQKALLNTYVSNLLFLSEYDSKLFTRIQNLSDAIDNGIYKERYFLEFIEKAGDFDIYDTKEKKYIYNKKPTKFNSKALRDINFDLKGSISSLPKELFAKLSLEQKEKCEEIEKPIHSREESLLLLSNHISEYIDILEDRLENENKKIQKVSKFVFLGTLLGRHIPNIVNKITAESYFVYESNLEIFRLSLFVIDYRVLTQGNSKTIFSIMDNEDDFKRKINSFIYDKQFDNYLIKYYSSNYNVSYAFEQLLNMVSNSKANVFDVNMVLYNVLSNASRRINSYKTLVLKEKQKSISSLENLPVIFIGAGPSLDDSLDWLKENHSSFVIVAMGASFGKLLEQNIHVDIVFTIDPKEKGLLEKQFTDKRIKKLDKTIIIAAMNTAQKVLDRFDKDRLFLIETYSSFYKDNIIAEGFSVGEMGFRFLIEFGFSEIFLIGTDLSLNQETGSTHIKSSSSEEDIFDMKNIENRLSYKNSSFDLRKDVLLVPGNKKEKVYSIRAFTLSSYFFDKVAITNKKSWQKIYNTCENGVFIKNTIPTLLEEIDLNRYKVLSEDLNKNILNEFNSISKSNLEETDLKPIEEEINFLYTFRGMFEYYLENERIESFKEFEKNYDAIVEQLISTDKHMDILYYVYARYFGLVYSYIKYYFNLKDIKKEKEKIGAIENLWLKSLINITEEFIYLLEEIKKPKA